MPIHHEFFPRHKVVVSSHVGVVHDEEFSRSYKTLFTSDDFDLSYALLVDLRNADSSTRSVKALREMSAMIERVYAGAPSTPAIAVLAPKSLSFGLSRMYQTFSASVPGDFAVFRAADAALAWLRVSGDVLSNDCP